MSNKPKAKIPAHQWIRCEAGNMTQDVHCPDSCEISGSEVLPFLLDMNLTQQELEVKPSQLLAALSLSTEDRLERMRSPMRKYKITAKTDPFIRCPDAIIFQNFNIGEIYTTSLVLTNQRSVTQCLKVYFEPSRFFTLSMNMAQSNMTKFAPGLSKAFQISFVPTDGGRDFKHEIKFVGELTEFTVPIYAIGPRPIAHVPDVIRLPPTLVNVETSATIVLRNTGKMPLNYSQTVAAPFSCSIPKAVVPPNGIIEGRYRCYPTKPGFITGKVRVYFRYDFCITIDLECDAKSVQVQLDTHLVTFEDIFMGLCSRKVLTLHNKSEHPLNFAWKLNEKEDEHEEISKLVDLMAEMKEYEQKRFEKLEYLEIVDGESHAKIYDRIFEDEQFDLRARQSFLYRSNFFQILPKVGKIMPNSTFEFSVVFQPSQNIFYYSVAYLDIEGTERRTRVSLQGYGIGPPVVLTVKSFNAGQIFLTDKHQYELAVRNKGVIPATVTYQPKKTDWGGTLSCLPNSLVLDPDSTSAFLVLFSSKLQGEFIETLDFKVEESGQSLQCLISGTVVCPLLKCLPDIVDFGTVSVGSCNTQQITLVNESRVTISYDFEFEDEDLIGKKVLEIVPTNGKVPAFAKAPIKMLFYSDATMKLKTDVLLVMWKSRQYAIKLPIQGTCACPQVTCEPKVVKIKFCFLNCNYTRTITLTNQSDFPGCIEYIPQKEPASCPVFCAPNTSKLYLEAHQSISMELQIKVSQLGNLELPLVFSVIGGISQTLCTISCNGQGPVVSYQPDQLDFGKIEVLQRYKEKLTLVNDSPIPAKVRVFCKNDSCFHIEESESSLELSPEEETQVTVWALFNSPGPNKDTICVEIYQGDVSAIKVSAVGEGTSILCEPPLAPFLDFGTLLTYKTFTQEVQISNKGIHRHKMLFTKSSSIRAFKESEEDLSSSSFIIEPRYLELDANCSTSITIKSFIKKPKKVSEKFYCQAVIGKSPQIKAIIQFTLEADFVDPKIYFSRIELNFNLDVYDLKAEGKTEDVLAMDNETGIPIPVRFTVDETDDTFTVVNGTGSNENSSRNVERTSLISIYFNPSIKEKRRHSQNARLIVEYGDHPKTDIINLHGEVMFPTIKLYPEEVNFHCVPLGSTSQATLIIHNISNMVVEFQWLWLQKSIDIVNLHHDEANNCKTRDFSQNTNQLMMYIDHEMAEVKLRDSTVSDLGLMGQEVKAGYDSEQYFNEMKQILAAILPANNPQDTEPLQALALHHFQDQISKIFSLAPSEGTLMPNEYSIVTIGFTPPLNTEVTATAICRIQGGAEEHLTVTGRSSKLRYSLDKQSVNLGNQIFCEVCSAQLKLTNTGLCAIEFKVIFEELLTMQAEMLDVTPKIGNVPTGGCVSFKIDYFPGYPGRFSKKFSLELGYLEAVPVNVHGYAVFSQVHLNVPRSDMELDFSDCYKAVSWITPEYLGDDSGNLQSGDLPPSSNIQEQSDWVYVSYNETYPSLMDINMAMERIVAFNLVSQNPKLLKEHTNSKKYPYIPSFLPSPYIVDFGYIVRDIPVCYTILIYNYGPISADVRLLEDNKTALLEKEIKIEYKPKTLAMGESIDLYVLLSPTKRKCSEINQQIEAAFRLSIKHGPVVSVKILAEVTLPIVSLEHENLYFDNVYVGDVLRKSIILSNNGYVQSKWFGEIIKPNKKDNVSGFFMVPNQGLLEPGEQTCLDIYFVPSDTRSIRRTLRIDVEWNSEPVFLFLYGHALEASLMILPGELTFLPTLNYFQNSLSFEVQNMAEIPLEISFPYLDPDFEDEKQLIDAYVTYKNLKHVFIPTRIAGSPLPEFFATTYNDLVCKLRKQLMLKMETKDIHVAETEDLDAFEEKPPQNSGELEDPLLKYSPKELHSLLMDYMTAEGFNADAPSNTTTYKLEDSGEKIEIVEAAPKPIPEEFERRGVLFIFHGAPNTEFYKGANQFGIALSIPVYSIDRLIIESLLESTHSIAADVLATIDNAVMERINVKDDSLPESSDIEDNEYDKLLEKIQIILTKKPQKQVKVSSPKEKGSKASSDKSPEKGKEKASGIKGDSFLNIPLDHLVELIKPKLKTMPELIIESLSTTFILHENQALYALLRAAGPLQYINLVIFSYTISDFMKNEADKLKVEMERAPNAANGDKARSVSPPVQNASPATKKDKASAKSSDKTSKISRGPRKSGDISKKILQSLNKSVKTQLEAFENLRHEIWHIVQFWDKHSTALKKPYSSSSSKRDASSKDSARTNKTSMKKQNSNPNMEATSLEPGLFCWLITNCPQDRGIDYTETIRNCIKQDVDVQRCLKEIEDGKYKKLEESQAMFSVISKVDFKKTDQIQSPVFSIKNCPGSEAMPLKDRSKTSLSKVKRKRSSRGSRKSADSRSVNDTHLLPVSKATSNVEFSPKTVLQPGDLIKYQVRFCPKKSGMYKYKYSLVTTESKTPYQVSCNAICEFPHLDTNAEIMFPKTLESYKEKASYDHFVFIKDLKIFDFGSIVAGPTPEKCLEYASSLLLRNASSSPCEVFVSLSNDTFSIEPSNFMIPPKSEDTLRVLTKSAKVGTFTTQMYISIKNNPVVEDYTLACSPCKLEFSIFPKTVNFDKVPLHYSAKRIVKLTNTSPINLRWEFVEPEWAAEIFEMPQTKGFMGLYSVSDVVFRFNPREEMLIAKKQLQIRVFDVNSTSLEPCFVENIPIHVESVEYHIDFEQHIDFGDIKGGVDHKTLFPIANKGKCEVALKIEIFNNPLERHDFAREYFKIQPLLMTIGAQKSDNLSIIFHPKRNFCIQNLLVFVVSMMESIQSGHVVKSYKVCPASHLNFGHIQLLTPKKLKLILTNKGRFPFSFAILSYEKFMESQRKVAKKSGNVSDGESKKGKKSARGEEDKHKPKKDRQSDKKTKTKSAGSQPSSKTEKAKTAKITKLDVGGFIIVPSTGFVPPGDKLSIDVEIEPHEAKGYKEKILLNIAEIEDKQKNKVLSLEAIGCEPKINLTDLESVFLEQFIVANVEDFVTPKNVENCVIFCTSDCSLQYKKVCINSSISSRLHLKNIGFVTAHLSAKIDDGGKNVFSLIPSSKTLEPYSNDWLQVIFKPNSLEKISGLLELSYNASSDNKLTVQLHGQGCLPQIKLKQPEVNCVEPRLMFGPLCVGFAKSQRIVFENVGEIKSNVIAELSPSFDALSLLPTEETLQELNVQETEYLDKMKHNVMVNLAPGKEAQFDVVFKPTQPGTIQAALTLHTVQNPYEVTKILITSESFDNDIIFEGLEPTKISTSSQSLLNGKNAIGYLIYLGYKQLDRLYKQSFLIRNRSADTYRFQFCSTSVLLIPEVGHLKPNAWKEVLVIFKSSAPVQLCKEAISCSVQKIQYVSPDGNMLSWDDRQKFVYWIADTDNSDASIDTLSASTITDKSSHKCGKSVVSVAEKKSHFSSLSVKSSEGQEDQVKVETKKKVIMEGGEPEAVTVPDTYDIIPLYVSVTADYARYECVTNFVHFPDTYIKEETVQEFEVKNSGTVPLNITWELSDKNRVISMRKSSSETSLGLRQSTNPLLRSASSTSLLSGTSAQEIDSLSITMDSEKARIDPGETQSFSLKFAPQKVDTYEAFLKSRIDCLDPALEEMCMLINASALPVPFYFELDGLSNTSQEILLKFENIGIATESSRQLSLVNPCDHQVTFDITIQDQKEFSYFACDIPQGHINRHKKSSTSFSFCPPILGSFKEQYVLKIPQENLQRLIKLQGICREPRVNFSENSIVLKSTVPKVKSTKSLRLTNEESFPVSFKFVKKTLFSECQQEKLEVYPIVGKLKPQSESDIKITFTSPHVVTCDFHVKCLIEKRKSPLVLHISGSCIQVQLSVSFSDKSGKIVTLKENQINPLDLGSICKGQREQLLFKIQNIGQTGIFFEWEMDVKPVAHLFKISVNPEKNFIKSGSSGTAHFLLEPLRAGALKQFKVALNIMYGPIYILHINASSEKPNYSFSFNTYNFGHCLVQIGETSYYKTMLVFKNSGTQSILLQNTFEKNHWLSVDFTSCVVPSGELRHIPIRFFPQKPGSYKENVAFALGANRHIIYVTGEAVNVKLELCKPKDKFVNFGEVLVHSAKKYRIGVSNNSPARMSVHFALYDNLILHTRKMEKISEGLMKMPILPPSPKEAKKDKGKKKEEKPKSEKHADEKSKPDKKTEKAKQKIQEDKHTGDRPMEEDLQKKQAEERQEYLKSFAVSPNMFIDIPARGTGHFDITFQPSKKMEFEEKIYFEVQDYIAPLCIIKGASISPEFTLDRKEVLFLGVITGHSSSQYVSLRNSGDVIGSFTWCIDDKQQTAFIIEPKQGFVLPNNDMKIKITFCSADERCERKIKAKCLIKETKEPLELVLKGNAIGMPAPSGTITLKCNVREKVVDHSIAITNNTLQQWLLIIDLAHEAFSSPREVIVPATNSSTIPVTYFPKEMTLKAPDQGTIFIKMPDGSGLIYQLIGHAAPPSAKKRIEKEIRCKQNNFEAILVENWLTVKQIFTVSTEVMSVTPKTIYQVFGFKNIELEGMESKSYKWGVYVVNEGPIEFKVTFTNPETGEYEFLEIVFKVLSSEPVEVVKFHGRVREPVTQHFTLENPVDIPITFTLECAERNLTFPKWLTIKPYTSAKVDLTYSPLLPEDISTTLSARCEELGAYTFLIKMRSDPPRPEPPITFRSELGFKSSKTILFHNSFDRPVDFTATFNHEEFHMERCNSVAPGDTAKIILSFEPTALGCLSSQLVLVSSVAGQYIYPLEGEGTLPSPKGPFIAKPMSPAVIEFKNPFKLDKQFKFCLQPDIFCCDFGDDFIKAGRSTRYVILLRSGMDIDGYKTGKLVISPDDNPEIQWKYYLESSR